MLPKSSAPPDTDNLPGTTVSAATGNRFIKTTSTLIETGTVVYEVVVSDTRYLTFKNMQVSLLLLLIVVVPIMWMR